MRKRTVVLVSIAAVAVGLALSLPLLRAYAPAELAWRLEVVAVKLRGDLGEMPLRQLIQWSLPGSPVYLEALAQTPNPHASIRNGMTAAEDARLGRNLYVRHCSQCHGERGRSNVGPSLVESVGLRSDWSFLSTAKWGRPGTSMAAQPLTDADIWRVHAYLRDEALAAGRSAPATVPTAARAIVDVAPQQLLDSDKAPAQWLTYGGNYLGHRHSLLAEVTKANVAQLRLAWAAQLRAVDRELQVSPIVADGMLYVSQSREGVVALDAASGDLVWTYRRPVPDGLSLCCGAPNRGVAIVGRTVFVATIDAHLVALDANTGKPRWTTKVADAQDGYTMTGAPLALGDRVVVGVAGGEFGIRGFVAAFDAADGRLLWRFNTVPGPGEPGHETWAGDSWKTGGAPTWATGAYDARQNLVFWGVGNPGPVYQADARAGDNLYSNAVVAIDAATGRLRWHFQFTPADAHDWDSAQQPVLAEIEWRGAARPVVLWANRNGFFYALDRRTGEFLFAKPFVKQTWNQGFDAKGRPQTAPGALPSTTGSLVWPASMSATHWWPPAYDPLRQLLFVPSSDAAGIYFRTDNKAAFTRGQRFEGGSASFFSPNHPATAFVKAIDTRTGEIRWQTVLASGSDNFVWTVGGLLSTSPGVVFSGYANVFRAFDADTGRELWAVNLGARVRGSPVSYAVNGRQYVAVAAGSSLFAFALPVP